MTYRGYKIEFLHISYSCKALGFHGYTLDTQLMRAIDRTLPPITPAERKAAVLEAINSSDEPAPFSTITDAFQQDTIMRDVEASAIRASFGTKPPDWKVRKARKQGPTLFGDVDAPTLF